MSQLTCALAIVALAVNGAFADTPASQVSVQTVQPTQSYPEVSANGEGWFDVGGFCKVVDVGDLSAMSPPASGIPVFVPGPTDQWENYRTSATSDINYKGRLTLTTCCRPQTNIATLCTEAGATPVEVSRQYGKVGEVDTVTASCVDSWGKSYTDQVNVTCEVEGGGSDGPDAQGEWVESGSDATSGCTANAYTSPCSARCPTTTGTTSTEDSCGNVTAVNACTISCCVPSYSYGCSGSTYVRTDNTCGTGSVTVGTCTLQNQTSNYSCSPSYGDQYPDGTNCYIEYYQCQNDGWANGTGNCTYGYAGSHPTVLLGSGCTGGSSGSTDPVVSQSCTNQYWAPP